MAAKSALVTWQQITVNVLEDSSIPSPRAGHSLVYDSETETCVVFGGASHEFGVSNETFLFHTSDFLKI